MTIKIEFKSSYEASITLDGRKLKYGYDGRKGCWRFFSGIEPKEHENTIGGLVLHKLSGPLIDILQGSSPEFESPDGDNWKTWEMLPEEVAEAVEGELN